jgi:hypothetical protein
MGWKPSLLIKLISTSRVVRCLELLAIETLNGVDRFLVRRGVEDCEIIKAKVSPCLVRTRHLLGWE